MYYPQYNYPYVQGSDWGGTNRPGEFAPQPVPPPTTQMPSLNMEYNGNQSQMMQAGHVHQQQQSQLPQQQQQQQQSQQQKMENYETGVYLGVDEAPPEFDVRSKVLGETGENLEYLRRTTGAKAILMGKGSGIATNKPIHIHLEHSTLKGLEEAEKLACNLVKVVQEEYQEWKAKEQQSKQFGNFPGAQGGRVTYEEGRNYSKLRVTPEREGMRDRYDNRKPAEDRDKYRFDEGPSYSRVFASTGMAQETVDRNDRRMVGSGREGQHPQLDGYQYEETDRYSALRADPGRSRTTRWGQEHPADSRQNEANLGTGSSTYCVLCDIHCPNQEMYRTHCKGLLHTQKMMQKSRARIDNSTAREAEMAEQQKRELEHQRIRGEEENRRRDGNRNETADDWIGGTHWEGPPSDSEDKGGTLEDDNGEWRGGTDIMPRPNDDLPPNYSGGPLNQAQWVYVHCKKLMQTQVEPTALTNLHVQVRKLAYNDKELLPKRPQTSTYCKICQSLVPDMDSHANSSLHGQKYVLRQVQLGIDNFVRYYGDVSLPKVFTDGGRQLALDALPFGPCLPEEHREEYKQLLVLSGIYLEYKCSVCGGSPLYLHHWIQHVTSKKHTKSCVTAMISLGWEDYVQKFAHIPIPPPNHAMAVVDEVDVQRRHPSVPSRNLINPGTASQGIEFNHGPMQAQGFVPLMVQDPNVQPGINQGPNPGPGVLGPAPQPICQVRTCSEGSAPVAEQEGSAHTNTAEPCSDLPNTNEVTTITDVPKSVEDQEESEGIPLYTDVPPFTDPEVFTVQSLPADSQTSSSPVCSLSLSPETEAGELTIDISMTSSNRLEFSHDSGDAEMADCQDEEGLSPGSVPGPSQTDTNYLDDDCIMVSEQEVLVPLTQEHAPREDAHGDSEDQVCCSERSQNKTSDTPSTGTLSQKDKTSPSTPQEVAIHTGQSRVQPPHRQRPMMIFVPVPVPVAPCAIPPMMRRINGRPLGPGIIARGPGTLGPVAMPGVQRNVGARPMAAVQRTLGPSVIPGVQRTFRPSAIPGAQRTVGPSTIPGAQRTVRPSAIPGVQRAVGPSAIPGAQRAVGPRAIPGAQRAVGPRAIPGAQRAVGPRAIPGVQRAVGPSFVARGPMTVSPGFVARGPRTVGPGAVPGVQRTIGPTAVASRPRTLGPIPFQSAMGPPPPPVLVRAPPMPPWLKRRAQTSTHASVRPVWLHPYPRWHRVT